jgi:predicted  nucleic acid-binding Zn-ribbon protein
MFGIISFIKLGHSDFSSLQKEMKNCTTELTSLKLEYAELQREYSELKSCTTEITSLKRDNAALQQENSELKNHAPGNLTTGIKLMYI